MDDQTNGPKFGTNVFLLDITPHDFYQWILHVLQPVAARLGLVSVQWGTDRADNDKYGVIEIATLTEGGHWRDILATLDVMTLGPGTCVVELKGAEPSDNDELLDWLSSAILAEWPQADTAFMKRRREQEKQWRNPIPLSDLAATAPSSEKLARDYAELHKLDEVYKRNLKNEGGHPPLECNDWAYAELQRRPKERQKIFRVWCTMYVEEVGPEVAELRDLREAFNGAMRYRKQREEKKDKTA